MIIFNSLLMLITIFVSIWGASVFLSRTIVPMGKYDINGPKFYVLVFLVTYFHSIFPNYEHPEDN